MGLASARQSSEDANGNGADERHGSGRDQQNPSTRVQIARRPIGHDGFDSSLQIGPGHAGRTRQGRRQVGLANVENPFRVDPWFTAEPQNFFVAGSLPFLDHPLPDPPDQGMEPEDGLDEHLHRSDRDYPGDGRDIVHGR